MGEIDEYERRYCDGYQCTASYALHRGTWHRAAFPREPEGAKFLVIFAEDTEANDLETREIPEAVHVNF